MGEASPRGSSGRVCMSGYLHKIEIRAIGLISRRRYWYALSETSPFLYWFKERDDFACAGRLCITGAAMTHNPREMGRFEIHVGTTVHTLEATSNKLRDEWMRALQDARRRSRKTSSPEEKAEISSLSISAVGSESNICLSPVISPSADYLIANFLGPQSSESEEESINGIVIETPEQTEAHSTSLSTFYVDTNGDLNDKSMEMPKEISSPETVIQKLAEKTNDNIMDRPRRVLDMARKSIRGLKDCEECKSRCNSLDASEQRIRDLEEENSDLRGIIDALKQGLATSQKQIEMLKQLETISVDEQVKDYLLEKEKSLTELQLENNALNRKFQQLHNENDDLNNQVTELTSSVEAFRDSVRTKEELIMRLYEEQSADKSNGDSTVVTGDVDLPEGILIDVDSIMCDEVAQKVFDAAGVHDVNELKDLVEGYKNQNSFLNSEIIELHSIIQSLESRERQLIRKNFDIEACYYQLKSRYLMVLNHFKSPEKPGKIMEPGVLRKLLDEANKTHRQTDDNTDTLGFYVKRKTTGEENTSNQESDLLDEAAKCMEKSNDIMEATSLEQSESYISWLQSWDALLVNFVGRPLPASNELKTLVRSSIPAAYRCRVWKSLVTLSVKDKMAEFGSGYFQSMMRKANAKKEEGIYDSAIKQIDLDLYRTLPTNKHFDDPTSSKMDKLRQVLYAFRYHNKDVGYCQGLNRLAAIALLYLNEEDSFWFMVACVEHLQPEGYYTTSLIGAVADQRVLRDLVAEKLPKLAAHLKSLEVDLSLFTLSWFLTCFVDVLPHSMYLSIFDIFLYEGNKVLFRFALAVLKQCEPSVLQCKTIGTVHACLSRASEHISNFKTLSHIAFSDMNPFSQKNIETKRASYLAQLKEQGYS